MHWVNLARVPFLGLLLGSVPAAMAHDEWRYRCDSLDQSSLTYVCERPGLPNADELSQADDSTWILSRETICLTEVREGRIIRFSVLQVRDSSQVQGGEVVGLVTRFPRLVTRLEPVRMDESFAVFERRAPRIHAGKGGRLEIDLLSGAGRWRYEFTQGGTLRRKSGSGEEIDDLICRRYR
jgi:hypothetical protein